MRRFVRASLLTLGIGLLFAQATPVQAYDTYKGVCDRNADSSAVCQDKTNKNPLTGNDGLLINIANIVSYIAGAAAVIMIMLGAFKYVTSGSDMSTNTSTDNDVEEAKNMITAALIGLAIIVLARTIINYVILKL